MAVSGGIIRVETAAGERRLAALTAHPRGLRPHPPRRVRRPAALDPAATRPTPCRANADRAFTDRAFTDRAFTDRAFTDRAFTDPALTDGAIAASSDSALARDEARERRGAGEPGETRLPLASRTRTRIRANARGRRADEPPAAVAGRWQIAAAKPPAGCAGQHEQRAENPGEISS